jgi:biotin carboxylase
MSYAAARPLLLVVGSSYAEFREYIFRSISTAYRLWLLSPSPPTWEQKYVMGHTSVNCMDVDQIVAAGKDVAAAHELAAVFCYDEAYIEPAAHASAALGFHTLDPQAVANCRDKSYTRQAVRDAGLLQPRSVPVASVDQAREVAADIGYPVMLKPRNLGASLGVVKVERPDDLDERYALTDAVRLPGVREFGEDIIVEEFIEGPEISVDSVFFEGECTPLVVAHKMLGSAPPFDFEEVGHDVYAADPLLDDPELHDLLVRSHEALGFRNGVTHTEFKVTPRGMYLVEVNARMGGNLIPYLGLIADGVDSSLAAAAVAVGRRPVVERAEHRRAAAIRFVFPAFDMEVTDVTVRKDLIAPPLYEIDAVARPGMQIYLPPRGMSHSGYVISVADTVEEARAAVTDVSHLIQVEGTPLEVPAE